MLNKTCDYFDSDDFFPIGIQQIQFKNKIDFAETLILIDAADYAIEIKRSNDDCFDFNQTFSVLPHK